jgi:SNF2 family DNA or RNA helicase
MCFSLSKFFKELVTGIRYRDVSTKPYINNAITLFEKLSLISLREMPPYTEPIVDPVQVHVDIAKTKFKGKASQLRTFLDFEQLVLDAKIPKIIERINGQPTIIYTQFVTGIIPKISQAVREKGYSVAEYTGTDHSGIERFKRKQIDVLVASEPASTGVDGLQDVCHNLIISGLPWTNARYQQLVGRLVRIKQENDVTIHIIKANINGREYDEIKWRRILDKRTLADCAVDGKFPFKNIPSPQKAIAEMRKWLERMERGEHSTIERKALEAEPIVLAAAAASAPNEEQEERKP